MSETFAVIPGSLTLRDLRSLLTTEREIELDPACFDRITAAQSVVAATIDAGAAVYGVNTGFGALAGTRIAADQVSALQRRLVLSHSAGVGPLLPDAIVRLIMLLKIASLRSGLLRCPPGADRSTAPPVQCRRRSLCPSERISRCIG